MTRYGPEPLPDRDPTPPWSPPHDPDAQVCGCVDCCEREWQRQQDALASEPVLPAWMQPIDKREMRRRE